MSPVPYSKAWRVTISSRVILDVTKSSFFLVKRFFDFFLSFFGLLLLWPIIVIAFILASIETRSFGLFIQLRIGQFGEPFYIYKIKTMHVSAKNRSSVTVAGSSDITFFGRFMRKFKIDELPQLFNVFIGKMSFVGPRPDVPGFADCLTGPDRRMLQLKPGITGPASIKYRNEESILASVDDPFLHNQYVIWPDKVRINIDYLDKCSLFYDLKLIFLTLFK